MSKYPTLSHLLLLPARARSSKTSPFPRYETYFPWVDNIYSHRSRQTYKRRSFVTHYYDCRLKGRPPGTPKSNDPAKKQRKRVARQRDLCGVKIKMTEYRAGSASELHVGDGIIAGIAALEEARARIRHGPFWVIQRINGNDGKPSRHQHSLAESDRIKKSSAQRWLAAREKDGSRNQKPSPWKPTGEAATTAKQNARDAKITFYSACFW